MFLKNALQNKMFLGQIMKNPLFLNAFFAKKWKTIGFAVNRLAGGAKNKLHFA